MSEYFNDSLFLSEFDQVVEYLNKASLCDYETGKIKECRYIKLKTFEAFSDRSFIVFHGNKSNPQCPWKIHFSVSFSKSRSAADIKKIIGIALPALRKYPNIAWKIIKPKQYSQKSNFHKVITVVLNSPSEGKSIIKHMEKVFEKAGCKPGKSITGDRQIGKYSWYRHQGVGMTNSQNKSQYVKASNNYNPSAVQDPFDKMARNFEKKLAKDKTQRKMTVGQVVSILNDASKDSDNSQIFSASLKEKNSNINNKPTKASRVQRAKNTLSNIYTCSAQETKPWIIGYVTDFFLSKYTSLSEDTQNVISATSSAMISGFSEVNQTYKAISSKSWLETWFPNIHQTGVNCIQFSKDIIMKILSSVVGAYYGLKLYATRIIHSALFHLNTMKTGLIKFGSKVSLIIDMTKNSIALIVAGLSKDVAAYGAGVKVIAAAIAGLIGYLIGTGMRKCLDYAADAGVKSAKGLRIISEAPFAFFTAPGKGHEWYCCTKTGHFIAIKNEDATGYSPAYNMWADLFSKPKKTNKRPITLKMLLNNKERQFIKSCKKNKDLVVELLTELSPAKKYSALYYKLRFSRKEFVKRQAEFRKWIKSNKKRKNPTGSFKTKSTTPLIFLQNIVTYECLFPKLNPKSDLNNHFSKLACKRKKSIELLILGHKIEKQDIQFSIDDLEEKISKYSNNIKEETSEKNTAYAIYFRALMIKSMRSCFKGMAKLSKKRAKSFLNKNKYKFLFSYWDRKNHSQSKQKTVKIIQAFNELNQLCKKHVQSEKFKQKSQSCNQYAIRFSKKHKSFSQSVASFQKYAELYNKYLHKICMQNSQNYNLKDYCLWEMWDLLYKKIKIKKNDVIIPYLEDKNFIREIKKQCLKEKRDIEPLNKTQKYCLNDLKVLKQELKQKKNDISIQLRRLEKIKPLSCQI